MNKIPKWVWLLIAAGGAYYLYNKYKAGATIALTGATVGGQSVQLPGTPSAVNTAGQQIASGITQLFNA